MKFIVVGDVHTNSAKLSKAIEKVKKIGFDFEAIALCGDLSNTGHKLETEDVWSALCAAAPDALKIACMGNHDYGNKPHDDNINSAYREQFENITGCRPSDVYEYGEYTFITLSANNHSANFTLKDGEWLDGILSQCRSDRPVFIISHYPAKRNALHYSAQKGLDDASPPYRVIEKYPNVIIFSGHTHAYCRNLRTVLQSPFGYTSVNVGTLSQSHKCDDKNIAGNINGLYINNIALCETDGDKLKISFMDADSGEIQDNQYISGDDSSYDIMRGKSAAPILNPHAEIIFSGDSAVVKYDQADGDTEFYKAVRDDGCEFYQSSYYYTDKPDCIMQTLPMKNSTHSFRITAVNFFGIESQEKIELTVHKSLPDISDFKTVPYNINDMWSGDTSHIKDNEFSVPGTGASPCIISPDRFAFSNGFEIKFTHYRNNINIAPNNYTAVSLGDTAICFTRDVFDYKIRVVRCDISFQNPLEYTPLLYSVSPIAEGSVKIRIHYENGRLAVIKDGIILIDDLIDIAANDSPLVLKLCELWTVTQRGAAISELEITPCVI